MNDRSFAQTLRGIGPTVPLSEIEISARQQAIRAEMERYQWLVGQLVSEVDHSLLSTYLEPLRERAIRQPGSIERSLVALSIHPDSMAKLVLATYRPPEDLQLFFMVCREARVG